MNQRITNSVDQENRTSLRTAIASSFARLVVHEWLRMRGKTAFPAARRDSAVQTATDKRATMEE